jgi:hypothetical protein
VITLPAPGGMKSSPFSSANMRMARSPLQRDRAVHRIPSRLIELIKIPFTMEVYAGGFCASRVFWLHDGAKAMIVDTSDSANQVGALKAKGANEVLPPCPLMDYRFDFERVSLI